MLFFQPWMFWLALTLPAILALYILRPRRRQTVIPSTMLWRPVAAELEASRPWQRLQPRLLLWLQLLAAVLLVLAATGPVWFAPTSFRSTIVLLDASASMRAVEDGVTRFQEAREEVVSLATGLRGDAAITVVAFDRQPRVIVRAASNADDVRRALEELAPSACAADPAPAFSLARALARQLDNPRLVLVSDGGITPPDAGAGTVEFIPVGRGDASVAIAALNLRPAGAGQAAQVAVANHGSQPASGRVSLKVGNYPAGSKGWELAPGESLYLQWSELPREAAVSARLETDSPGMDLLKHDNFAWAVPEDRAERKVLLVSGGN
ncbi:MAG: BatA and WFA domain-containing protein, partial [Firmicutes bacterium]|nr:BatA and WFA domain-containing protein [Bacillota bacterium]